MHSDMLTGTPLLLRTVDERGQEGLHICTCKVDAKGELLQWCEQDGKGRTQEVRISSITEVVEERADDDDQKMLKLTFKGCSIKTMELICASQEDFATWRNGLMSLVDRARPSPKAGARAGVGVSLGGPPSSSPKAGAKAAAAAKRSRTLGVSTGVGTTNIAPDAAEAASFSTEGISSLLERLKLQEELITELRQENGVLNEMVKQKDTVIAQLMRDRQSRGTKTEQCNKTESTSRESDDHLRDRESAILKRKNLRLKKLVQKKQQTITNLMQTLQSALGGQTSDGDMLKTEDEGDEVDSDAANGSAVAVPLMSDGSGSEPEAIREEVRALTGKLARLERDVEEMNLPEGFPNGGSAAAGAAMAAAMLGARQGSPGAAAAGRFQPPPRAVAAAQQPPSPAQQRAAMAAAAKAGLPAQGMAAFDFSAVGGVPSAGRGGMSKSSKAALEALAKEMELLEDKKRTVEQLARQLEPPSDNEDDEEDDGFPLQ